MRIFRQGYPPNGNGKGLSIHILVKTRKLHIDWLEIAYLGCEVGVEITVKLGIKFCLLTWDLNISNSILGLCSSF